MPEYPELIARTVANELSSDMRLQTMDRTRPQSLIARIIESRKEMQSRVDEASVVAAAAPAVVREIKSVAVETVEAPHNVELHSADAKGGLPPVRKLTLVSSQKSWYASACWPGSPAGSEEFCMGQATR